MATIKNAPKAKAPNKAFVKAVALDKALEAYKYSQKIGVLQLAKEFEKYLLS